MTEMEGSRRSVFRRRSFVVSGLCSFALLSGISHAQLGPGPVPDDQPAVQGTDAERAREAERARAANAPPPAVVRQKEEYHRPGEFYVGGFGGYTFGGSGLNNAQVNGQPSNGFTLNDSGIYGMKFGYFMPDRLNWLGFEVEGFNTSPNIKQSANGPGGTTLPGASLRVTTLAFNAIIRGKFACGPSRNEPSRRTTTDTRQTTIDTGRGVYGDREDSFCPLQPYVGAGLGVFFAHTNGFGGNSSSSDNAVPGFNGLAGVKYFVTEHVAIFGEYKYQRATFNFDNVGSALGPGTAGGLHGDYSVNSVVAGLSLHF
jgi:opacity protein-like surface antigen